MTTETVEAPGNVELLTRIQQLEATVRHQGRVISELIDVLLKYLLVLEETQD